MQFTIAIIICFFIILIAVPVFSPGTALRSHLILNKPFFSMKKNKRIRPVKIDNHGSYFSIMVYDIIKLLSIEEEKKRRWKTRNWI